MMVSFLCSHFYRILEPFESQTKLKILLSILIFVSPIAGIVERYEKERILK